jgi:hypothetical protein
VPVKLKVAGFLLMVGVGAAVTVKVTGTETFVAPVAPSVMVALYVPAVREPVAAVTVIVPVFPVPEAGETVSHEALSLAVQVRVPPPVLLRAMV